MRSILTTLALSLLAFWPSTAVSENGTRVLVVTATHGYRHEGAIAATRALLESWNATSGFTFTLTGDLARLEQLDDYEVIFFANSTLRLAPDTPNGVTAVQRAAVLKFIEDGGGFVGAHSALDAGYGWTEYRMLVGGGLFHSHPWTQRVRILNEAPDNPITAHLGSSFELIDEIYLLDQNPRPNANVLLSLDPDSVDMDLLPTGMERRDIPIAWTRTHGAGRVFITKLGHFSKVWQMPDFQAHLLEGLRYAAGKETQIQENGP